MDQKYVTSGTIAFLVILLIVFVIMFIRKKTPCKCPEIPPCQQKINQNEAPLKHFYTNETIKKTPTFAIRDKNTGLYLGLCDDNTTVCLTKNEYLILSVEENYVPIFENLYPILNAGKHKPIKSKDGRYLAISKDGTKLILENTKPETFEDEELRLFFFYQAQYYDNLLITKTFWIYGLYGYFSRTITIVNGNVSAIYYGDLSEDDRIKALHIWEIVPVT